MPQDTFRPLLPELLVKRIASALDTFTAEEFNKAMESVTRSASDDKFVEAARKKYVCDGDREIAIDPDTVVSESEEGAFVMAWVWVANHDMEVAP